MCTWAEYEFFLLGTEIYISQFVSVIPIFFMLWHRQKIVIFVLHSSMSWNWFENILESSVKYLLHIILYNHKKKYKILEKALPIKFL